MGSSNLSLRATLRATLRASDHQAQILEATGNRGGSHGTSASDPVLSARFTPDGSYLLSTTKEQKLIHLWNPRSGTYITSFRGHGREVRDVDVERSNGGFVSCGGDYHVFKWDVESGRVVGKYRGHDREVNCARYDRKNCHVFASGSGDQSIRIWDARSKNSCIQVLGREHFKDSVLSVDWTDEGTLFGGCVDGSVKEFDVRQGRVVTDFMGDPVTSVNATERYILVACMGSDIKLLDRRDGRLLQSFSGHQHTYSKLTALLTGDEQRVVPRMATCACGRPSAAMRRCTRCRRIKAR
jgi:mitogen-activated protein kinase organizer 1